MVKGKISRRHTERRILHILSLGLLGSFLVFTFAIVSNLHLFKTSASEPGVNTFQKKTAVTVNTGIDKNPTENALKSKNSVLGFASNTADLALVKNTPTPLPARAQTKKDTQPILSSPLPVPKIEKAPQRTKADENSESIIPVVSNQTENVPEYSFCLDAPVLFYHHIEPIEEAKKEGHDKLTVDSNIFELQMKYLHDQGYQALFADELPKALRSRSSLPGKNVTITIDDGYSDFYTYGFPIAKKYNLNMNLMISTGLLENKGYLTWDNLREMVASGLIRVYDHTWSHYSLPGGNLEKIEQEVATAKKQLEENLGVKVDVFTYPYGTYDQKSVNVLIKNGFIGAYSTVASTRQCEDQIYYLRRTRVGNYPLSSYGL